MDQELLKKTFSYFWDHCKCPEHNITWRLMKEARREFPDEEWLFKINSTMIKRWVSELRKTKQDEIFADATEASEQHVLKVTGNPSFHNSYERIIKPSQVFDNPTFYNSLNLKKETTILVAGCIHIPKHDKKAVSCLLQVANYIKPDIGILLGDIKDNPYYSKHNTAINVLMEDARKGKKETKEFFEAFYSKCKEKKFIRGNHEAWIDLVKEQDPYSMEDDDFTVPKIIGFNDMDVEYFHDCYEYEDFVFRHGTCISSNADTAAKQEFQKELKNGCSAHLHRTGRYRHSTRTKEFSWHIVGTLAQTKMWYDLKGKNRDNSGWNQSFLILNFIGNRFQPTQVEVFNGKCIYDNKEFIGV